MISSLPRSRAALSVGLTGSIGSGKSTVAEIFRELGASIVDADELSRKAAAPGSDVVRAIADRFGGGVISADGSLDRKALAALVFPDPVKLKELEAILHPAIHQLYLERLAQLKNDIGGIIVYVAPLIFESRYRYDELDKIVLVVAAERIRVTRVMQRDRCTELQARQRVERQLKDSEKAAMADYIIENNGTPEELRARAITVYQILDDLRDKRAQSS